MSKAIRQVLPLDFSARQIHILGHSHGAKVATVAAVNLNPHPAHLTLFDSPERGLDKAKNKLYLEPYLQRLAPSRTDGRTFVDSYYSMFGVCYNNQSRPTLKDVVDVRLRALPCNLYDPGCRHSYPMKFYQLAKVGSGSTGPGILWSPLLAGPFKHAKADYLQSWQDKNRDPLAFESGDNCFGSPSLVETSTPSISPRSVLSYVPLLVKIVDRVSDGIGNHWTYAQRTSIDSGKPALVRAAYTRMEDPPTTIQGDRQVRLDEREVSLVQLAFTKEEGDDAILFDFAFLQPGDGDEFTAWIDDFMLSSLRAPDDGQERGRVAVGIDDFENGPHTLTLVLYGVEQANTAINISNIDKAKVGTDGETPAGR